MTNWSGGILPIATPTAITPETEPNRVVRAHRTLLSLQTYAEIMGLDALHLAGGTSATRPAAQCDDVWFEYDWQDEADKVSREQLLREIEIAEDDIAKALGWWPGPVWIEDERQPFPRAYRSEYGWLRQGITARTNWGYVRGVGQRTQALIAGVVRGADIDADGDGFDELAHFTVAPPTGTTIYELRAYFKDFDALDADNCRTDPGVTGPSLDWQVYPLTCRANGANIEVYIPVWWLFKPQLRYGMTAAIIDADDADSYVDTLMFYREYAATTLTTRLAWHPSDDDCAQETADVCGNLRDPRLGMIHVPSDQMTGVPAGCNQGIPNELRLWYYAGATSLSRFWAENIAILATARLVRPLCSCGAVAQRVDMWQADLAKTGTEVGYQTGPTGLVNPFGTHKGEDYVWKRIQRFRQSPRPILT